MMDIVPELIMISKASESGPNDDGHIIGMAVKEIEMLRGLLREALDPIRFANEHNSPPDYWLNLDRRIKEMTAGWDTH